MTCPECGRSFYPEEGRYHYSTLVCGDACWLAVHAQWLADWMEE
jgi:hypothetical protein